MVGPRDIQEGAKPHERRSEVCNASVGLSATLSAVTIGAVALVVVLILLLT
jgi:hypothetical protein